MIKIDLPPVYRTITLDGIKTAHDVSEKGGIYVFYDGNGAPLYAGKSINLYSRLRQHARSEFYSKVNRVDVYVVDDAAERDIYETYVISTLSPRYNREKVYVNKRAQSDKLLEVESDLDGLLSEYEELKQELKFEDWHGKKYGGCTNDYLETVQRIEQLEADIKSLNDQKTDIIRRYFK